MRKLKVVYVDRLPRQPEDLPPDVVEVYIGLSRKGVELDIVRNGFLAAENVKHAIQRHIRQLLARGACGCDLALLSRGAFQLAGALNARPSAAVFLPYSFYVWREGG